MSGKLDSPVVCHNRHRDPERYTNVVLTRRRRGGIERYQDPRLRGVGLTKTVKRSIFEFGSHLKERSPTPLWLYRSPTVLKSHLIPLKGLRSLEPSTRSVTTVTGCYDGGDSSVRHSWWTNDGDGKTQRRNGLRRLHYRNKSGITTREHNDLGAEFFLPWINPFRRPSVVSQSS